MTIMEFIENTTRDVEILVEIRNSKGELLEVIPEGEITEAIELAEPDDVRDTGDRITVELWKTMFDGREYINLDLWQ